MNYRLQQFLSAENITQAQFADMISVARASVSHIIAGRNKPGFDFIQNMSRHFPDVNLEWLINGKGKMYKDGRSSAAETVQPADDQLFSTPQAPPQTLSEPSPVPVLPLPDLEPEVPKAPIVSTAKEKELDTPLPKVKLQASTRRISRIVVFYDDGTYQELKEA